jgi:hydroxyacylglutathione hydrolase
MNMILRQFLHEDPIASSYLFGCVGKSVAAVVDPVGSIEPYLALAAQHGMEIRYVIDTHVHADHLSPPAWSPTEHARTRCGSSSRVVR